MPVKTRRAVLSWEGTSIDVLRGWPRTVREDFGVALAEMQEGRTPALQVRPMPSIAAGVFELKDSDESKWYRLIYLARVKDTIYVLHCFTKNTAKTEKPGCDYSGTALETGAATAARGAQA